MTIKQNHAGHMHVWERAVSRRQFIRTTAGATGVALAAELGTSALAQAPEGKVVAPKPIPGGVTLFDVRIHHFPPVFGNEPSQITDFNGIVANTRITGSGTGTDQKTGATSRLLYQADMGFMFGLYIGADERPHRGAFGFI